MEKKLIIHVIESLKVGGAEVLLKNTIDLLPEFEHMVVYFQEGNKNQPALKPGCPVIKINYSGWGDMYSTVRSLKRIITDNKPEIVHSHLLLSSVLTRLATPKNVCLINSLHSIYSIDAFSKNKKSLWAERLTLKKRHSLVAVSKFVLDDYLSFIPFDGKKFVLYNFVPDSYYSSSLSNDEKQNNDDHFKCVAIGNLKEAKNYSYLLQIMEKLKDSPVTLDIYGEGQEREQLLNTIEQKKLKVRLCGSTDNIPAVFRNYDLFIQASQHEGFGLSVIEAMASKLPVFISDIPVFREITSGLVHFFPLNNAAAAANNLITIQKDQSIRNKFREKAFQMVKEKYSQQTYRNHLLKIYDSAQRKD